MEPLEILKKIKSQTGKAHTVGLADEVISKFLVHGSGLSEAITEAWQLWQGLPEKERQEMMSPEEDLLKNFQSGILNFYSADGVSPYIPLTAQGPWIVTAYGAVLYDAGGYGMLGFGHNPEFIFKALNKRQVMSNIMTPSFAQKRLDIELRKHIGFKKGSCPYSKFVWMNSGSEAVTVGYRIIDAHTRIMTDPRGKYEDYKVGIAAAKGGFHGRTDSAAQVSDSSIKNYKKYLATFRDRDNLHTIELNNEQSLTDLFSKARSEKLYIEALFLEPVMGEGDPGRALTRQFYDLARKLTKEHDAFLVIDSIQAGFRAHGCLSIVDYPGFEGAEPPDMETFSKALNAGQFPLSVLGLSRKAVDCYKVGLYGNTMTANPRALDVAQSVLEKTTPELAINIESKGKEYLDKFRKLQLEMPNMITKVQGTGLLFGVELNPDHFRVLGHGGAEEYMRRNGINVIHGGPNSLRFTPHFWSTSAEIDLVVGAVREAIEYFKKKLNFESKSSLSAELSQDRASPK